MAALHGFLLRDLPSNVVIKNFDIVENLDEAERTRLEAEAGLFVPSVTGEPSRCMHVLTGTQRTTATLACPCVSPSQDPLPRASVGDVVLM